MLILDALFMPSNSDLVHDVLGCQIVQKMLNFVLTRIYVWLGSFPASQCKTIRYKVQSCDTM